MKRLGVFLLILPVVLSAYPLGMQNLRMPSPLNRGSLEFEFQHRFFGSVLDHPLETFFGLDAGSNTYLGLKYTIIPGLELGLSRISYNKEYDADLSYSIFMEKVWTQARLAVEGFTWKPGDTLRVWSAFPNLTFASGPLFDRIRPSVTAGYDIDASRFGLGAGLVVVLFKNVGYFEDIALVGEFYPYLGEQPPVPEEHITGSFLAGVALSTYGHQFMLTVSNSTGLGARNLEAGVLRSTGDIFPLQIGFTIRRLLARGRE
jgi:hypothetical protein